MTAQEQHDKLKQIYEIIEATDSPLIRYKFLVELAALNDLPAELIIKDFEQWQTTRKRR